MKSTCLFRSLPVLALAMAWLPLPLCAGPSAAATWSFDDPPGPADGVAGSNRRSDAGVRGKALKLDGFSTRVERAEPLAGLQGGFSVEAWVALQEYPWNWTAVADCSGDTPAGFFLGLDYQGTPGMKVAVDGKWVECMQSANEYHSILHTDHWDAGGVHSMVRADRKVQVSVNGLGDLESTRQVSAGEWTHVAWVYKAGQFSRLYLNGKLDASMRVRDAVPIDLGKFRIGGWNGGGRNFKGGLDEVRIHHRALDEAGVGQLMAGAGPVNAALHWAFENGDAPGQEGAAGRDAAVEGTLAATDGRMGKALQLDGKSAALAAAGGRDLQEVTVSAWVRPEIPDHSLPLHTWNHVVGTYDPNKGIFVYLNGEQVGFTPATGAVVMEGAKALRLGASHERFAPIQTERGPSMKGSLMLLSGLLDEVAVHDRPLDAAAVAAAHRQARPPVAKPLDYALMPTGPLGRGAFGASMENLRYNESWDNNFRLEGEGDVVVKFDDFPFNYVFWRGWNYGLCMVTENGLLMSDQSVERSNENGCTEHMSDKQNRYARIRIVENHDARVVLCWRYNPCDIFYGETNRDPASGWGDWAEEYFHIYPDGVMMREQRFYTTGEVERRRVGGFGGWPSNQETIFFNQPGKGPLDTVDVAALTVANDAGESRTFSWQPEFPGGVGREPSTPTIQMVNFKSKYRPYMLRQPGATIVAFPPSGFIDRNFPYWNHWPVAQLWNDGRKGTRTDRPAHTSLAWFCEPPVRAEGILYTWNYVYGLTDKPAEQLADLSKSWNSPPPLTMSGTGYHSKGYDNCERAYVLKAAKPGPPAEVSLWFPATKESPYVSPGLVIHGWNGEKPTLTLNGTPLSEGRDCRIGIHHELEQSKLVIWIRHEASGPVSLKITPATP